MKTKTIGLVLVSLCFATPLFSQGYNGDARRIGMGGNGDNENAATKMIEDEREYRSIVIPLGLIQLLKDLHYFKPHDPSFNPVRALEEVANPLHIGTRRGAGTDRFVADVVNATLSRDLNTYRGFVPAKEIVAEGLAAPSFGHTFRFKKSPDGGFHGIYAGAGPYISVSTRFNVDDRLRDLLASSQDVKLPNTAFQITDLTRAQAALSVTVGYRGRVSIPGVSASSTGNQDGIYIAGNYHYLHGFRYDSADLAVRFDTDSAGLLTLNPLVAPLITDHIYSPSGSGFAVDAGVGAVIQRWHFGVGANGLANRIEWDTLRAERYRLQNYFNGANFVRQGLVPPVSTVRVELPVDTSAYVSYNATAWSAATQFGHGFQGTNFHAGIERRLGVIELRGGARYARELWHPAVGLGVNISSKVGIDVAAFDTTANIQRDRRAAFAASIRINRSSR